MAKREFSMDPIQWYEGMLLLPQHFQQADLRLDQLMAFHMSTAFPFYWGITKLQIDQAVLTTGTFRVLELEAVMPDGLFIAGLGTDQPPVELALKKHAHEMQVEPITIYLCVPELHGDDADLIGAIPRYSSVKSKGVMDVNTGQEEVDLPRLHPNVYLIAGTEPPAKYTSMPIAKVGFDSKSYSLTPFIPPFLNTTLQSTLGKMCDAEAQKLRTKLGYLQQKVQGSSTLSETDSLPQDIENIRLKLIAGLLPFEAVYTSGKSHPYEVYKILCALAGHISGVRYGELPPHFEPYNHNEILASIQQILDYTDKVMAEIEESYSVVPFKLDGSCFKLMLKPEWLGTKIVLSAKLRPGMSQDEMAEWIRNCVVVSEKHISVARDNRVLGTERRLVDEVSALDLVPVRGVQLFVVDNDPQYITPGENLCIFNDSDSQATRPEEILLYNAKTKG